MKRKRLKAVIMSAVILSTIVASGCSADNAASKSELEAASGGLTVSSDSTASKDESKSDSSAASGESKTESSESTNSAEEPAPSDNSDTSETEWKETAEDSVKYVSVDCYSRKTAILGAETVKLYSANEKVEVVAITDTGYCKLKDGTFIHSDYLSNSKVTVTTEATAAQPTDSEPTASVAPATTASTKAPADVSPAPATKVTTTSKPKETTATTKAPAPVPSTPSAAVSGYTWVIEPSYDYDDVAIVKQFDTPWGEGTLATFVRKEYDRYEYNPGKEYKGIFTATDTYGKWGLVDSSGITIIDNIYDKINISNWLYKYHYIEVSYLEDSYGDYKYYSDYWLDDNFNEVKPSTGLGSDPGFDYFYDIDTGRVYFVDWMMGNRELTGDKLSEVYKPIISAVVTEGETKLIYGEEVLQHNFFTDRSGTGMYGLISGGKITVPMEYEGYFEPETADEFSTCNRIVFWKNNKIYVFDKDGNCYSDGVYDKVDNGNQELYYFNDYLAVCRDGKWGLIDVNGNEVVECCFDDISSVYDGKAWAKQNGKWGVIELA